MQNLEKLKLSKEMNIEKESIILILEYPLLQENMLT